MMWLAEGLVGSLGIVRQCRVPIPINSIQGELRIYVVKRLWAYGFSAGGFILIREDAALSTHAPRWQKEMYLEEYYHSLQYIRENPAAFPLKYLAEAVFATLRGKDYYAYNKYEVEAKDWAIDCYDGKYPDPYPFDIVAWGAGKLEISN